jgi:peptidoglycan hydrolase CwlO-like protein
LIFQDFGYNTNIELSLTSLTMSDFLKLEKMITELTHSVGRIESEMGSMKSEMGSMKSEMGSMKSEMGSMKSEMGSMKSEMQSGFRRLEELVLDTRDEMRSENAASRTLINQAFTHISDQLAREGDMDFVPKYPRVKR